MGDQYAEQWYAYLQYPKQQTLRDWEKTLGDIAVITRQVDKNRHALCISCLHFHYQILRKMFLKNPQYKTTSRSEVRLYEQIVKEGLAALHIRGIRPKPPWPHTWSTTSIFHKNPAF